MHFNGGSPKSSTGSPNPYLPHSQTGGRHLAATSGLIAAILLGGLAPSVGIAGTPAEENTIYAYERVSPSVVLVVCRNQDLTDTRGFSEYLSRGSGFAIGDGLVITNYHVVENATQIEVYLGDGNPSQASIVGTAPVFDIAVLRTLHRPGILPAVTFGDAEDLRIGQKILAVGSPFGLENSVTSGIISGLNRDLLNLDIGPHLIQFDAPINPGQSGGPLVDSDGRVVGVILAKVKDGEAVGFAIPVNMAVELVPDLIRMGHPFQPQIGMQGTDVTSRLASLFDLSVDTGFLIEYVEEGLPADLAGLESGERFVELGNRMFVVGGDIILAVDDTPIYVGTDLAHLLRNSRPGAELELLVHRNGTERSVILVVPPMKH